MQASALQQRGHSHLSKRKQDGGSRTRTVCQGWQMLKSLTSAGRHLLFPGDWTPVPCSLLRFEQCSVDREPNGHVTSSVALSHHQLHHHVISCIITSSVASSHHQLHHQLQQAQRSWHTSPSEMTNTLQAVLQCSFVRIWVRLWTAPLIWVVPLADVLRL